MFCQWYITSFNQLQGWRKTTCKKPPDAIKSPGSLAIQVKFSLGDRGHFSHQDHNKKKKKRKGIKSLVLSSFYVTTKPLSIGRASLQLGNAPDFLLPLPPGIKKKKRKQ